MSDRQSELPEAAASVTYTIQTTAGFNALFTVRDVSGMALLDKMENIEKKFESLGIKPQPVKSFGGGFKAEKKVVGKCPTCGADLVEATKKDGSVYWKCSTNKYDFTTKTSTGCQYVDWDAGKPKSKRSWDEAISVGDYSG